MAIIDRNFGKCEFCGETFIRERISKKTCSSLCRKSLSRQKQAKSRLISDNLQYATDAICKIGNMLNSENDTYESIEALNVIRALADLYDISEIDSWWRCKECWAAVQKKFPLDEDCECDKPRWVLQKTLI